MEPILKLMDKLGAKNPAPKPDPVPAYKVVKHDIMWYVKRLSDGRLLCASQNSWSIGVCCGYGSKEEALSVVKELER